jgi:hypothetical protein
VAEHGRAAGRWTSERRENAKRRRFSCAVGAEQAKNSAALNGKGQIVNCTNLFLPAPAIHFDEMLNADGNVAQ